MMKLSSSKNSTLVLLTLLIAVLLFAIYYYFLLPKKDEVEALETSVGTIKSEISALQSEMNQMESEKKNPDTNEYSLRKKVPKQREIDELILNIEEIEYVTGSRILSINFNNYDQAVADSSMNPANGENASEAGDAEKETGTETADKSSKTHHDNQNGNTEVQPVSTIADMELPPSLKMITFSIDVEAPNHEKLIEFIREIEKLERIMHVDTIEYDVPGEEQVFEETPREYIDATIQVTTFFYTGDK